jgi:DNA-binding winged helix-turn-helix (wHTH) protein
VTPLEATAAVGVSPHRRYVFDDFEVDLDRGSLARGGEPIPLRPKSFAMLLYLL